MTVSEADEAVEQGSVDDPANGVQTPPAIAPLGPMQRWTAVGLLVGFAAFLVAMIAYRNDKSWDRLVFLFSGYEAIVFAGAGALFGREIHRGVTEQAQAQADAASQRADSADARSTVLLRDAERGRALAAAAKSTTRPAAGTARGARPTLGAAPETGSDGANYLATLAASLFPDA